MSDGIGVGRDMPSEWDAAQRWLEQLRGLGPGFTGESHPLSPAEAWRGPGRLYVRCERLGVQGMLKSFARSADECVVALQSGSVKVPRAMLEVLEVTDV